MKRELDKYGIQMPAFSKIGGILANEITVDEAAGKHRCFALMFSDVENTPYFKFNYEFTLAQNVSFRQGVVCWHIGTLYLN